jgi:hypothetical protein
MLVSFFADGLSRLIHNEIDGGQIEELKACSRSLGISHSLLADDGLLLFKANPSQTSKIKAVLNKYEKAIRQLLIPEKFSLLIGSKCLEEEGQVVDSIPDISDCRF